MMFLVDYLEACQYHFFNMVYYQNDDYLEAVQKATNALFLTRCFLSTFIKECSDEELLHVFNVPLLKEIIITPSNYNRCSLCFIVFRYSCINQDIR